MYNDNYKIVHRDLNVVSKFEGLFKARHTEIYLFFFLLKI